MFIGPIPESLTSLSPPVRVLFVFQNLSAWSIAYTVGLGVWLLTGVIAFWGLLKLRRRWLDRPRARKIVHAGLGLWMLLAMLTLPEIACALFYDQTDSFSQTNVSRRWFKLHVEPNRDGFRDDLPLPVFRKPNQQSIVFVGDSFTFGHGVKNPADRFTDRLRAHWDRERPERVLVSNASLPGTDIRMLADTLVADLYREPHPIDLMVYVFVPNDIEYCDDRTAHHVESLAAMEPRGWLFGDTYFYNLLWYRWQSWSRPEGTDYYGYLKGAYTSEPWPRFTTELDQLRETCKYRGTRLAIVAFPFLHDLGTEDSFSVAHEQLGKYCQTHDTPFLDLRPALAPHVSEGLVVNRFDSHPNPRAHELAAAALAPWLETLLEQPNPAP